MSGIGLDLAVGLLVGGALALWPGTTLSVTIREASRRPGIVGLTSAAGRTIADLLVLVALGVTVTEYPDLFAGSGVVSIVFGVLAGGVLACYGWRLMEYHTGGALARERGDGMIRAWHQNLFLDRLLGSLGSPVWHLFWWTGGCRLVAEAGYEDGAAGVAAFAAGFLAAGAAWRGFVAFRLASPRRERALRDRQFRILTSLGGLALVGIGLGIGIRALAASPVRRALQEAVAAVFA